MIDGTDRRVDPGAEVDTAIRQLVSEAMAAEVVIDIYAETGLDKPDISLIDDDFVRRFPTAPKKNLQIEMVRRLTDDQIKMTARRDVVVGWEFSEMLESAVGKYQNRTNDAA